VDLPSGHFDDDIVATSIILAGGALAKNVF
jgi:hypothetical protein